MRQSADFSPKAARMERAPARWEQACPRKRRWRRRCSRASPLYGADPGALARAPVISRSTRRACKVRSHPRRGAGLRSAIIAGFEFFPSAMSADPKVLLTDLLMSALKSVAPDLADTPILLERPKQASHGDFATNLALQLAKPLKRNPRELAGLLLAELPPSRLVAKAEVAGAGFINFTLAADAKTAVVREVLAKGADFGRGANKGVKVQVEFVSANPTGPLHVGHGRGAAYGASLADVLAFAGYDVTREYYVNDAGRQMDILALSTWLR